ncbi:hypothetical protein CLV86_0182 [Lacinutrix venerupis]|uniref:Uncharacterized protein n=1 Tax=Lacinutrix venerupis TaxID=1486034 RepID=A0AAC9LMM8_9FLAO|nr:hypothetical protein [Lacinutrix venerupis]APY00378.1 hypothetical protein BWR22_08625 [Lacinutrix venerupis]RLJ68793.1 hypothetical protein CLV86_0182 [Lacinutrix venerupis]
MSDQLNNPNHNPNDQLETGMKILSFCIPLAGAIIYFTSKDKSPNKAKQACHMALYGAGAAIVINILFTILGIGASAMGS